MRSGRWAFGAVLLLALSVAASSRHQIGGGLAPLYNRAANRIPNQHIVKVFDGVLVLPIVEKLLELDGVMILHKARLEVGADRLFFNGFAFKGSDEAVAFVRRMAGVEYVEQDAYFMTMATQYDPPSWGLDRVDQRELPLDSAYSYNDMSGSGVNIYLLDTGIEVNHVDFSGRARVGVTIPDGVSDGDLNGHGTHVAGIAVGTTYGVAKNATVISVKVLNDVGSGSTSDIVTGIEWVAAQHLVTGMPSVMLMPVGGSRSITLDSAVDSAIAVGVHVVTAAGQSGWDSCEYSPGGNPNVINVFATGGDDRFMPNANYGTCVTLGAPGETITSAWIGSSFNQFRVLSGSSMACPHVAGVVALVAAVEEVRRTPAEMKAYIESIATEGVLTGVPENTPNLLVYNNPPL